jgi:hypothetical protein
MEGSPEGRCRREECRFVVVVEEVWWLLWVLERCRSGDEERRREKRPRLWD